MIKCMHIPQDIYLKQYDRDYNSDFYVSYLLLVLVNLYVDIDKHKLWWITMIIGNLQNTPFI